MDTVRYDVLASGGEREFPAIFGLAKEGVFFEHAYPASTYTLPSHMSLFTGLDPLEHGLRSRRSVLDDDIPLLAEMLTKAGYRCRGFHEGGFLSERHGYSRGFVRYETLERGSLTGRELPRILAWIQGHAKVPYFLFLHTYTAHNPYGGYERYRKEHPERGLPPADRVLEIDRRFLGPDRKPKVEPPREIAETLFMYNQLIGTRAERARSVPTRLPAWFPETKHFEQDMAEIRRSYRERIERIDAALGKIVDRLKRSGQWSDTLFILLSDHGEGFFEHGRSWHGFNPHEEVLHVTLVISYPRLTAGRTPLAVKEPVWQLDLLPTIRSLVGLPRDRRLNGMDLTPVLSGGGRIPPGRAVFPIAMEVPFVAVRPPRRIVVTGRLKLIMAPAGSRKEPDLLFDLEADPGERRNLAPSRPEDLARLRRLAERYEATLAVAPAEKGRIARPPASEEEKRLRTLGYGP